uniref:Cadherin-like protein n=1 Tax=Hyphantria cunea TaxID=39466 RepID=A0A286R830_HYPCU|nr:cadherin-like protein [Hyphantria cunea]
MEVDVRIVTAALVLLAAANVASAQDRCSFMTSIPRPPRPEFPEEDFTGMTWSQRPFIPAFDREEVCVSEFGGMLQNIYMEEEVEGDVVLARLNYRGTAEPMIAANFLVGSFIMLRPVIRRIPEDGGDWHLVITERQDFETPGMQRYSFSVRVEGEMLEPIIALSIVNIDDNAPIIEVFTPCEIPETAEPSLTDCWYNVTDADGYMSTNFMTFKLESERNDNEIFSIDQETTNDQYRMYMKLRLKSNLDFAINALHIFRVTAFDSLPNTHTVTIMVQVENIESRPPRWVEIFAMQQFDEKQAMNFTVRALDGDTGIDRPIFYRIDTAPEDTFFHIETFEGGRNGAMLFVDPIDRDTLEREVFQFALIAYKNDDNGNEAFSTRDNILIIVNDINDQEPVPFQREYNISIMEETALTLNLQNFGFHDRDLGDHAVYTVEILAESPLGAEAGFQISPSTGYQRQSFILTTLNHRLLDFEEENFQNITLRVIATDQNNTDFVQEAIMNINLINWNDEQPIFFENIQRVTFKETAGSGYFVANVTASDRDIDDRVVHELLGNAVNFLSIDPDTGSIHVSVDNAFDYHTQSELFIQVQATDTLGDGPYHTATSQLVIQLIDINNTPPSLRLPRGRPEVEENVPEGFPIEVEVEEGMPAQVITASDPDTDAELVFEIDWESSYATKQGRDTPTFEFHNCVEIKTVYPDPSDKRRAEGLLFVKEIRPGVTIDFEEFEVLYITVRVIDLKTEIGLDYDEATFTIIIIDMNDNKPLWAEGSLAQEFRVRERSDAGVVIGSVLATDIDGPLYNQVRYTIMPRENTPENLVQIDFNTGQITVKTSNEINADVPRTFHLYYTLRASDACYAENIEDCPPDRTENHNDGLIMISIIDTNNQVPQVETTKFDQIVYVWENATQGDEVATIFGSDLDRDEMYHEVSYQIDYRVNPRLRAFFAVDLTTGVVYVDYTTHETLDRDGPEPTHTIFLILSDNFLGQGDGNRNQNTTEILVVLLDVNDNAPQLPTPAELSWTVSESTKAGTRLPEYIYAPDADEPDTDNSRVGYAILSLNVLNRDIEVPELFTMIQIQNVTGELETAQDLKGYWGTYAIHILAFDHGYPQQSSNETYELVITPYNFHDPVFVFPLPNSVIRVAREQISANGVLITVGNDVLERIHATDEDGLEAGVVTFDVQGEDDASEFFEVRNDGENFGTLILRQTFDQPIREFNVIVRGTDGGTDPGPRSTDLRFTIAFVPTQGEPIFTVSTATVSFFEEEGGLLERFQLPEATDLKNHLCEDNCHSIYYSIVQGNEGGHFAVEPRTNVIYLAKELNREESATHTVQVAASNSPNPINVLPANTLTVTVVVREANPRPVFVSELYTAGIAATDSIDRTLLTVQATHSEGAPIAYTIDFATMVVDPSLEAVRDMAFALNPVTGVLSLNFQPSVLMHGMFQFQIVATDPNGAYDRTQVKVYLISSQNRVIFRFRNSLDEIENNAAFIAQTFTAGFRMICNIDQIAPATDEALGTIIEGRTEVRAHFIRDNVPVPADEIERLRSDIILLRSIQETLVMQLVELEDFLTDISPDVVSDNTQTVVYVLIALTAVLGLLCLILLLTFILRTRALNRRLEALSMTKYGPVDSGLNRMGITPGTNKHAVEGSNPIWNETIKAPDFDAISNASNDSDLIGIEDLPQFRSDYFPPADDPEQAAAFNNAPSNSVATHNNNFGFNTTPFSPEFANKHTAR